MKRIDVWFIGAAILYGLFGMSFGIWMGITQAFENEHLHAHINLVGWVSMTLFGLVYRAFPAMQEGALPRVHFWVANLGYIVFMVGILLVRLDPATLPPVVIGSLLTVLSMLLFLVGFFRNCCKG
ncbi:MAG: cytochrome-c oxidase [Alphaproteobacteria bacterium]